MAFFSFRTKFLIYSSLEEHILQDKSLGAWPKPVLHKIGKTYFKLLVSMSIYVHNDSLMSAKSFQDANK